jgi:4-amino-4-deoxy-L-arabinose transferase-like glycosyltransferase
MLALLCGCFFFYGLTAGELYRTESLRAIIAAEFLRSGNWIVPTLYGDPLFTKPPGMYAAIALVSWPFGGVTEWTARLPSAIAATVTVLLMYFYFRRQVGRLGGLVVATVMPLSLMWLDKATAAEIDMMQVAWVTAALLCFLRALDIDAAREPRNEKKERLSIRGTRHAVRGTSFFFWWLAALLCVAGGVLTKWTAPAFFYGTAIPLLWRRGRLRLLWCRPHLVSAVLGAGVCFAWAGAAIAQGGWDVFFETVSRQALMHLSPEHHHRPYPWTETLRHPFVILGASLPMSVFALPALWPGFARLWDERGRRLLQVLHCWTWPNLVFWTLVPAHSPRHCFPLFPGLGGLAAMVWLAWLTGRWRWRWRRLAPAKALVGIVGLWLIVKLAFVHGVMPERNRTRQPSAKANLIAAHVPEGAVLYLFHLKDEGIMFYYGRPVRRLPNPEDLPSSREPLYGILEESERCQATRPLEVLAELNDEQGDPIVLVRIPSVAGSLREPEPLAERAVSKGINP